MGNTTIKRDKAIEAVERDKSLRYSHPKYRMMSRVKLYAVLESSGYEWNVAIQDWVKMSGYVPGAGWQGEPIPQTPKGTALIRIMCHRDEIDQRCAEFEEWCEAIGWTIISTSFNYTNAERGNWVRRNFRIQVK